MAYALQCTLPGTPVIRYGDEIGMGDDLSLPERNAMRTPMQWTDQPNAAFSDAKPKQLVRPVISGGEFGYETVNVLAQRHDPDSLLMFMERMLRSLRECPEFGVGSCQPIDVGERSVLALRFEAPTGVDAGADQPRVPKRGTVDAGPVSTGHAVEIFADRAYDRPDPSLGTIELDGYGFRWIRLAWEIPSGPPPPRVG